METGRHIAQMIGQADKAILTEVCTGFTRLCVERHHTGIRRGRDNFLRANCIIGIFAPRHAAAGQILIGRGIVLRVEPPQHLTRRGIKRDHLTMGRTDIERITHLDGRNFKVKFTPGFVFPLLHDIARVKAPCQFQLRDIRRRDLRQR